MIILPLKVNTFSHKVILLKCECRGEVINGGFGIVLDGTPVSIDLISIYDTLISAAVD